MSQVDVDHINPTDRAGRHANQRAGIKRPQPCNCFGVRARILEPPRGGRPFISATGKNGQGAAFEQNLAHASIRSNIATIGTNSSAWAINWQANLPPWPNGGLVVTASIRECGRQVRTRKSSAVAVTVKPSARSASTNRDDSSSAGAQMCRQCLRRYCAMTCTTQEGVS